MKRLALIFLVLAMATAAMPADWTKPKKSDGYKFEITECGKDCIQIKSKNNTIRYYSCGQVEKLVWKEINPNEGAVDTVTVSSIDSAYFDIVDGDIPDTATSFVLEDEATAWALCQQGYHSFGNYWVCD